MLKAALSRWLDGFEKTFNYDRVVVGGETVVPLARAA